MAVLLLSLLALASCEARSDQALALSPYFFVAEDGYEQNLKVPEDVPPPYLSSVGVLQDGARFDAQGVAEVIDLLADPQTKLRLSKKEMQARSAAGFEAERKVSMVLSTVAVVELDLVTQAMLAELPSQAKKAPRRAKKQKARSQIEVEYVGRTRGNSSANTGSSKRWKKVVMYAGDWCSNCRRARKWLDANNVRYTVIDVPSGGKHDPRYLAVARRAGSSGIPIFEIGPKREIMQGWRPSEFEEKASY